RMLETHSLIARGKVISAMERIKMPQAITIPISVMFRLFPTIGAEWRSIRRAMRMRGIHLGGASAAVAGPGSNDSCGHP
ncbi:MAG: hypothetical protein IJJ88_02345, partial [Oscillospiraceae bacterium]|nr:hypothetical protein [Oscillospiraceae bacterium]